MHYKTSDKIVNKIVNKIVVTTRENTNCAAVCLTSISYYLWELGKLEDWLPKICRSGRKLPTCSL